jgi:hypothetical protein
MLSAFLFENTEGVTLLNGLKIRKIKFRQNDYILEKCAFVYCPLHFVGKSQQFYC